MRSNFPRRVRRLSLSSTTSDDSSAALTGQFYEEHYRKWLDEPLPALNGRTPREAAGAKSSRDKLVSLLKAMENMSERDRQAGRPSYGFGWMWEELGVVRPG